MTGNAIGPRLTPEALEEELGKPYAPLVERFARRHAELLNAIGGPVSVRLEAEPTGEARYLVSLCARDCVGLLAVVAGLFAARRVDIRNGDVFSLPAVSGSASSGSASAGSASSGSASPEARGGRVLDVFEVVTPQPVFSDFWRTFETELSELIGLLAAGESEAAVDRVTLGLSRAASTEAADDDPLYPVSVAVDNEASDRVTELRIQSVDSPAFLFEFANALTLLDVNIERVEIRTLYGEVRDTFWVTDVKGKPIVDEERIHELRVATALIKQFSHLLPRSANPAQALKQFSSFTSEMLKRPDWTAALEPLASGGVMRTLAEMMGVSRFLWEDFLRLQHENLFPVVSDAPQLEAAKTAADLRAELAVERAGAGESSPAEVLNRFKDREMFRVDLRHITGRSDMDGFSRELTELAEAIIADAAAIGWDELRERHGRFDSPWTIFGAGKLGGCELGFASDIELIFVCDPPEANAAEAKHVFEEFARRFLKVLKARQNGVFEIDLRLRPFGESAPLTCTRTTVERYYTPEGGAQQFERLSLVKLRPVAGDPALGERVGAVRDGFVYAGDPLDLDNIRHLRARQAHELVRTGTTHAKYSPGGLADVEYFVQAQQIAAGALHTAVRVPNTRAAIAALAEVGAFERAFAADLDAAYAFLRSIIDGLRVVRGNAKDLTIPSPETREFDYLARRREFASSARLQRDLERHMRFARQLWQPSD